MKLDELTAAETEMEKAGYRARFMNGTTDFQYLPDLGEDGAPDRDGAEQWAARLRGIAAYKKLHDIAVVGPDLEPVDDGAHHMFPHGATVYVPLDTLPASAVAEEPLASATVPTRRFGATSANPGRMAGGVDLTGVGEEEPLIPEGLTTEITERAVLRMEGIDPDARAAIDGIPLQGGTVLADHDGLVLVGDSNAQVYVCPKEAVLGKPGINWRPKVKRVENVIMGPGDDGRGGGAYVPWLNWTGQGVTARAAFHNTARVWMVRR